MDDNDSNDNNDSNNSIINDGLYMYSFNNIIQESNLYYQKNLFDPLHNFGEDSEDYIEDDQDIDNDTNSNRNNSNSDNNNNQETSTVNSNDICLETSFGFPNNIIKKDTSKKSIDDQSYKRLIEHKRIPSAPLRLLNEFEKFKYSSQYIYLEKAYLYANKLILIRSEGRFDIESDEGNKVCHKFLKQIEALIQSFKIKGNSREYRKQFSKAYIYLFDEDSLGYLTEILDSAQEATPYLVVNGEKFTFSSDVIEVGNQLFASFCSLIMLLTNTVDKIREELIFDNIKELKTELKNSLMDFDKKWVSYEEKYINELINIEKEARRFIIDGVEMEKNITKYETKANIKGKLLINDKEYNKLREKFINLIVELNKVANIEGKGRDDLNINILLKAESVLCTVSDGKSKGMRHLANSIKESLNNMRSLFKKFEQNVEGIDPQLRNNPDLSDKLFEFEAKWEKGKEYLLDEQKYSHLLFFSQIIEILCEKYSQYQINQLIEERDPSIFVSIPGILLLKSIENEDKGICRDYIPNIDNINEDSGSLYDSFKQKTNDFYLKVSNKHLSYQLLEKLILFDGTKEQDESEKEVKRYLNEKELKEFKTIVVNLSMHLQRYKPCDWNTFFELAMNFK